MTHATGDANIGRRVREYRAVRQLGVQQLADLSGLSRSYISYIERGERAVTRRETLEKLAAALRVAPADLASDRLPQPSASAEHAAGASLRTALGEFDPYDNDADPPPWQQVAAGVAKVNELRPRAEYAELGLLLPDLLRDLYASLDGPHRRDALKGLADCYLSSLSACKNLGFPDLAHVAALRIRDVAHMLAGPEWVGLAAYARAQAIGSGARERAGHLAVKAANDIAGELDQPEVAEVYGMLHLMAALANTTQGKFDTALDHVNEAEDIARRPGVGNAATGGWMHMWFGAGNVGYWRTMLAVERGEGGRAVEIANAIDPATRPQAKSRTAMWLIDIGRAHAMEGRANREPAVQRFLDAENIAPQLTRSNPWVREAVTDLLSRARRDAGGRELRGLAHRVGIAV